MRLFSAPTPKVLEKKITIYLLYVGWSIRLFVEFVALLTKIWPKILIFTVIAKCWREGVMPPPPLRCDRCNLSCSFLELLIL